MQLEEKDDDENFDDIEKLHDQQRQIQEIRDGDDDEYDDGDQAEDFDNDGQMTLQDNEPKLFLTNPIRNYFDPQSQGTFTSQGSNGGTSQMLVGGLLLAIVIFVYRLVLNHIPPMQFLFIIFLFIFLINYAVMRDAVVLPFVTGEDNTTGKTLSILGMVGLICVNYSMEFVSIETTWTLFFCCGLIGLICDVILSRGSSYKSQDYLFCILALVGVAFILRPPFLFGSFGESHEVGHWTKDGWFTHQELNNKQAVATYSIGGWRSLEQEEIGVVDVTYLQRRILSAEEVHNTNTETDPTKEGGASHSEAIQPNIVSEVGENKETKIEHQVEQEVLMNVTNHDNEPNELPETPYTAPVPEDTLPLDQPEAKPEPTNPSNNDTETKQQPQNTHIVRENKPFKGMIFALVGSLLFSISAICIRRLDHHDYMTITHLFCLFIVVFTPAFFPMQGVAKPGIKDWILMIVISIFAWIGFLCFIKACQQQNGTGKVLSVLTLPMIGIVIAEICLGHGGFGNHFWGIIGVVCILVASILLIKGDSSKSMDPSEYELGISNNNGLEQKIYHNDEDDDE